MIKSKKNKTSFPLSQKTELLFLHGCLKHKHAAYPIKGSLLGSDTNLMATSYKIIGNSFPLQWKRLHSTGVVCGPQIYKP